MSCDCNSGGGDAYNNFCNADISYPSVSHESVPSMMDNLTLALYGLIQKDVSSGKVKWIIPCDPTNSATVFGITRNANEGLMCYFIRAFQDTQAVTFIPAGEYGQILSSAGTNYLAWVTPAAGNVPGALVQRDSGGNFSASVVSANLNGSLQGGFPGSLVYQSDSTHTTYLSVGSLNQVLLSNGTLPTWVTLAGSAYVDATNASNISSGTLPAGRLPAFSGEVTSSIGSAVLSLTPTGVSAGAYNVIQSGVARVPQVTVDSKGRLSNVTMVALAASAVTDTTNATNISSGTLAAGRLPASGATAATYGATTPQFLAVTVDTYGRITAISKQSDYVAYTLPTATASVLGGVKIGSNLTITSGVLSADATPLPIATASVLGGIKVGTNLAINPATGVLSANATPLLPATTSALGGVIVGNGLAVSGSGLLSVTGGSGTTVTTFTGNGSTLIFGTLNGFISTDPQGYIVSVGGIDQRPTTDFTIQAAFATGNIVFAAAPPAGATILVRAIKAALAQDANRLQGNLISSTGPIGGQFLGWNAATNSWTPSAIDAINVQGLAASATTDTTNASNITSGALRTDQLETISGLPVGAQGSGSTTPVVTVDNKGRVTILSSAAITPSAIGAIATDQLSTLAKLSGGALRTDQMAALTGDVTSVAGNPATTVGKLNGRTLATTAPTSGQVLAWDGAQWAPGAVGPMFYATVRQTSAVTADVLGTYLLTYTIGSPIVTCTNVGGSTGLVLGGTFSPGALNKFTIIAINANGTDVTMSGTPSVGATSQNNSAYRTTDTTFTYPTGAQAIDSRTIEAGDVVFFAAQVAPAQNGPWVCTTKGASGVSQVLTRPSWFTGTAYPIACTIQQGPTSQGFTCSLYPATVGVFDITVGVTALTTRVISQRGDNALLTSSISGTAAGLSATLAVASGGTGLATAPANGQIDIGNGTGFTRTTLTAGSNISITNTAGAITISSVLFNRIINGSMAIDQRNAGATQTFTAGAALAYSVDRWYGYSSGANVTGARVQGASVGQFRYSFTGAASVTAIGFGQRIEQLNSADLAGSAATLSVDLANSLLTIVTWTAYYANTADTFGSLASPTRTQIATGTFTVTNTVTRYSANITVPSAATTGVEIVFTVGAQIHGTWTIGAVQLEKSLVPTPFEVRPYGTELALCQRYACSNFPIGTKWSQNSGAQSGLEIISVVTNTIQSVLFYYPVTMRSNPSVITSYSPTAASADWSTNTFTPTFQLGGSDTRSCSARATGTFGPGYSFLIFISVTSEL